jgi:hypothetical protein
MIADIMPILIEDKPFVVKNSKYDLIFDDFGTGMEKMGIPGKKKDIGKRAMHTLVQL